MSEMTIERDDGKVMVFNLNHIGHAKWVMELLTVDGENAFTYSDPYPNKRDCADGAREFARRAIRDDRYGWVIPTDVEATRARFLG